MYLDLPAVPQLRTIFVGNYAYRYPSKIALWEMAYIYYTTRATIHKDTQRRTALWTWATQ